MIYVGIDITMINNFISAISSDEKELIKPIKFTNDGDGLRMPQSCLAGLSSSGNSSIIAFESAIQYDDNLVQYLVACNHSVC